MASNALTSLTKISRQDIALIADAFRIVVKNGSIYDGKDKVVTNRRIAALGKKLDEAARRL